MNKLIIDPEEVERYAPNNDWYIIAGILILIGIVILVVVWEPDVEAIGTAVYETLNAPQ